MSVIKSIYGHLLDWSGLANIPAALKALGSLKGSVGQLISISKVGTNGVVSELVAVERSSVDTDSTLTQSGQAADAKAVGDALKSYINDVDSLIGGDG